LSIDSFPQLAYKNSDGKIFAGFSMIDSPPFDSPLILTIDLGSSSLRCLLFDARGELIPGFESRRNYEFTLSGDGGVEIGADFLFDLLVEALDEILEKAGPASMSIQGVACSTFWHNLLGTGPDGKPLSPVLTWADTRSTAAAKLLCSWLEPYAAHQRTGCRFHPSYLPAKLLWFRQVQADIFQKAHWWGSIGEYFYFRLFGQRACSISMGSGTGLLNQRKCQWDAELLRVLEVRESQLSPLVDLDHPFHDLLSPYAERWPTLRDVPWFPALGDGACSNIGSGCVSADQIALMVGTSGAMRTVFRGDYDHMPEGLWCYHVDRQRLLMGGALSNGGNLFQWMRGTLQLNSNSSSLEAELASIPPASHGLTLLPFLAGERSTGWNPLARGVIFGMTLETRPVHILLAALEGVAYRFEKIREKLTEVLPSGAQIVATGGALEQSPLWVQIMADVLGHPVLITSSPEASSRGAALLALEKLGLISAVESMPCPGGTLIHPRMECRIIHQAAQARQEELYQRLFEHPEFIY
jgi:gluconokinase